MFRKNKISELLKTVITKLRPA